MEIWKEIESYPCYQVSNLGRIRSRKFGTKVLKPGGGKSPHVALFKNKQRKYFMVSGLVADAFLPPRPDGGLLYHIDGNSKNNAAANLQYKSRGDIVRQTYKGGKLHRHNTEKARAVEQYQGGRFIAKYSSVRQASRETGISHTNIVLTCQGRQKTAGGYKWQYK